MSIHIVHFGAEVKEIILDHTSICHLINMVLCSILHVIENRFGCLILSNSLVFGKVNLITYMNSEDLVVHVSVCRLARAITVRFLSLL